MLPLLDYKGPIEGYVANYVAKNGWKVAGTQTRDDLLQEGFIVYARVVDKYPVLDTPQHLMALFKTAWHRHFLDLANADTAGRDFAQPMPRVRGEDGDYYDAEPVGETDNEGALATMLRQAPGEVKTVLNLFLNAPQELLEAALGSWHGADRRSRSGGSARVNALLGLPPDVDAMAAVREYFS